MRAVTLGDVCDVIMGQAPPGVSYNDVEQGVPLLAGAGDFGATHPEPKRHTTDPGRLSDVGDILLCVRATIGERNWSERAYCLGRGVAALRVRPGALDSHYLWHWLPSAAPALARRARGSTFKQVTRDAVESLQIALPTLAEQRRIAAVLDKADGIRRKRRESLGLLNEFLRSAFLEMFGDPVRNEKGWEVASLGDLCQVQLGKMLSEKAHGGSDPVPYLRNANVQWRRIDLTSVLEMDFTDVELARFDLRPGDLLVCEGGEVGRCAIWEGQLPRCSFQKALHRVRPKDDRLRAEYLQDCLFLLAQRGALVESTSQATIAHLTKVRLEELPLPVPPRSLQERFVRLYRCAREASRRQAVRFDELDQLFDSLAQRAFGGAH